jgi:hypothetical protein
VGVKERPSKEEMVSEDRNEEGKKKQAAMLWGQRWAKEAGLARAGVLGGMLEESSRSSRQQCFGGLFC